ncbi:MAG: hypothetical protein ABID61_04765 [Candidatus Micrarchaeota archaeon]
MKAKKQKKSKSIKKTKSPSKKSRIKKQTRHVVRSKTQTKNMSKPKKYPKRKSKIRSPKEIIIHQDIIPQNILSDYVFAFELTKPYPTIRSYIIKQPLKKQVKDILFELFGAGK